ncbi:MAG: hypothetical protein ACKPKO_41050 [Candidatus Fonsibacter sp.]
MPYVGAQLALKTNQSTRYTKVEDYDLVSPIVDETYVDTQLDLKAN